MWQPSPYWAGISPGLMALKDKQRDAKIAQLRLDHPIEAQQEGQEEAQRKILQELFKSAYTLRGGTHLELAQLVLERALMLRRSSGRLGLVLPRQSMVLAGWKNLRQALRGRLERGWRDRRVCGPVVPGRGVLAGYPFRRVVDHGEVDHGLGGFGVVS